MDHLHLARGADALDADHAPLDNKEALTRLAFVEEILSLL
jgi:hypothetical protein